MNRLFFSRGRGRGHAIPDIALAEAMGNIDPSFQLVFVSYGTGAATFREFGKNVIDLKLPDDNSFLDTVLRASDLIRETTPELVISHEEFAAVFAAHLHNVPAVFCTDWFLSEESVWMQALGYARSVVFFEDRGIFDEPPYLSNKVEYVGPFVRDLSYSRSDRDRAREELGISRDACVITVLPGGWATEAMLPIADLVVPAFLGLDKKDKQLFWVAGADHASLVQRYRTNKEIKVLALHWPIEQLMVASDLVITKGNRVTIMECAELGVPTLSLSNGLNRVENVLVPRIRNNTTIRIKGATSTFVHQLILQNINFTADWLHDKQRHLTVGEVAGVLLRHSAKAVAQKEQVATPVESLMRSR